MSQNADPVTDAKSNRSALQMAFSWPVVRRALWFAVIVGSVLVVINHGPCCILQQSFSSGCRWQVLLTICVPYVVSTISSVLAMRQLGDPS